MGDWLPEFITDPLEDIWNAISTPPGSTTPILDPESIRTPEEVLEEDIIPAVFVPLEIPEQVIEDVTQVEDVDVQGAVLDSLKFGFAEEQKGVGLGILVLAGGAYLLLGR